MAFFDPEQLAQLEAGSKVQAPAKKKRGGLGGFLGNVAHGIVAPVESIIKTDIVNPTRQVAAQVSGNKVAQRNAELSTKRELGLGDKGTDFGGGLKKFVSNSAGTALLLAAPGASSIKSAAAQGAAGGAAAALGEKDSTLGDVIAGGLAGGATGGVLKGAGKVVSKVAGRSKDGTSGGFMKNLTTQGQAAQGRTAGISAGSKANGVDLAPQDTERMLGVLNREGIKTGNANNTLRDLVDKRKVYGKQIDDHFKANDNPLKPDDTKIIADNFIRSAKTTDPRYLNEAQILANDLQKSVKSTKDLWKFRTSLDGRVPDSKFADDATTFRIAAIKDMRQYIAKELGDVPGMQGYHDLSEIKPFVSAEAKRLNNPSGGIVGRVLSSGVVQKAENTAGKVTEAIGGGRGGKLPLKAAVDPNGVPPEITNALKNSGDGLPSPPPPDDPTGGASGFMHKLLGDRASNIAPQATNFASGIVRQGLASQAGGAMVPGEEVAAPEESPVDTPVEADNSLATPETLPSESPYAPENIRSSIEKILQQGGTQKDVSEFLSNAKILNDISEASNASGGSKALNSTASGVIADTKTGLKQLQKLSGAIADSSANNPVVGFLRGKNPLDTNAQNLQASIATAKQIVGKALEGGVLRAEDEKKYAKILPTLNDTDDVAQHKIQQLTELISSRLGEYQSNISGGSGGTDLAGLGL